MNNFNLYQPIKLLAKQVSLWFSRCLFIKGDDIDWSTQIFKFEPANFFYWGYQSKQDNSEIKANGKLESLSTPASNIAHFPRTLYTNMLFYRHECLSRVVLRNKKYLNKALQIARHRINNIKYIKH